MRLLFDECVPRDLLAHFQPHAVASVKKTDLEGLKNGALLGQAQGRFDVLVTTDTNIYHRQTVSQYSLAVLVLRAYRNVYEDLLATVAGALQALEAIRPGEVVYVYADEKLKERDRRKWKGPDRQ